MKIGMRTFKTALSVTLCILISNFFKMEYPFYAAIAAIICMQGTVVGSFKSGKNRMLGTTVGAAVGLLLSLIKPGDAFLTGIGVILVIDICNYFGWKKSISIGGIVLCAIMVNLNGRSPIQYSINRIIDTFLGIAIAVLVNLIVAPPNLKEEIQNSKEIIKDKLLILVVDSLYKHKNINLSILQKEIEKLEEYIISYEKEFTIRKEGKELISKGKKLVEEIKVLYEHLDLINRMSKHGCLSMSNRLELCKIIGCKDEEPSYIEDELNVIYNYHAEEIIKRLKFIFHS